jgi:hypothetical protein
MAVKRVNYFNHQLLHEQDFKDEQTYHQERLHRHNRLFHSWGVLEGLEVRQRSEREVAIEPGVAIDHDGREISLLESSTRDLSSLPHNSDAYITIRYHEEMEEADHLSAGGVEGYTRVTEVPQIHERRKENLEDSELVLARVRLGEHSHIVDVDMSPTFRKMAKVVPKRLEGWVRMPFKPVRMSAVRIAGHLAGEESAEHDFVIDEATAYCGERGARGSMQIPVPPGASRLTGFRIAGVAKAEVVVRLFRTGWNVGEGKGEKSKLLEEKLPSGSFHKEVKVHSDLDESHALAVSVRAEGEAEVWLVAARFE